VGSRTTNDAGFVYLARAKTFFALKLKEKCGGFDFG
jgi:hypothetical protein